MGLLTFSAKAQEAVVLEELSRAELRAKIEKYDNEFYRVFNANSFQLGIGIQLSPADLCKTLDKEFEALTEMLNALLAEYDRFKALNTDVMILRQMLAEKEAR